MFLGFCTVFVGFVWGSIASQISEGLLEIQNRERMDHVHQIKFTIHKLNKVFRRCFIPNPGHICEVTEVARLEFLFSTS